jgi:hypothetical protein
MELSKEKQITEQLLIEKLQKLTGKKVILKEGKFTNALKASGIDMNTDVEYAGADWKDIDGLGEAFAKVLKKWGLYVYECPSDQGSDQVGYIISKKSLNKNQIGWADKAFWEPIKEK